MKKDGNVLKELVMINLKNLNMKTYISLIGLIFSNLLFSQVAIGKATVEGSGILDFGPSDGTATKGIILPLVDLSTSTEPYTNGTFLMDTASKIVKVYQNGSWLDLSDEGSFTVQTTLDETGDTPVTVNLTTAPNINSSEEVGEGVIIGAATSTAKGILVLEATDKALILPRVKNPDEAILSPVAGTMCYDTFSNSLAIFDGKVWNYWK